MKLSVMVHDCEGEITIYIGTEETDVRLQLYDYVISRWYEDEEYIDGYKVVSAPPIPPDKLTAVTDYFERYKDCERLIIKEYELAVTMHFQIELNTKEILPAVVDEVIVVEENLEE